MRRCRQRRQLRWRLSAHGSGFVYTNTLWNPIALSWNLGGGWFVSVGFNFMGPDGSKRGRSVTPNPDYWTFEPTFAVAYLANNWNLAANFFYDINTKSGGRVLLRRMSVDR